MMTLYDEALRGWDGREAVLFDSYPVAVWTVILAPVLVTGAYLLGSVLV